MGKPSGFDWFKMHYTRVKGDNRSLWAIYIDTRLQAGKVYDNFNSSYFSKPNYSDVEAYDTRSGDKYPIPREPITPHFEPEGKPEESKGYTPKGEERARLVKVFHRLPLIKQHKDLLTTRNVIKKKDDVEKWRGNPYFYDINGIDTQPEDLVSGRVEALKDYLGKPKIVWNLRSDYKMGTFVRLRNRITGEYEQAFIRMNKKTLKNPKSSPFSADNVLAHELFHYSENKFAGDTGVYLRWGNSIKKPKFYGNDAFSFGKANNLGLKIVDVNKRNAEKVKFFTETRASPFDRRMVTKSTLRYRDSPEELFANWGKGLVSDKGGAKRFTRGFYNMFKKSNKDLFRAWRKSDRKSTRKFMSGDLLI